MPAGGDAGYGGDADMDEGAGAGGGAGGLGQYNLDPQTLAQI